MPLEPDSAGQLGAQAVVARGDGRLWTQAKAGEGAAVFFTLGRKR